MNIFRNKITGVAALALAAVLAGAYLFTSTSIASNLSLPNLAAVVGIGTNNVTIEKGTSFTDIKSAIESAESGTHIKFAAGKYDMSGTIVINQDNITISGAGEGKTVFHLTDPQNAQLFKVTGAKGYRKSDINSNTHLIKPVSAGSQSIVVDKDFGAVAYLEIEQANTVDYLDTLGGDLNSRSSIATIRRVRGEFKRVSNKNGQVTYKMQQVGSISNFVPYDLDERATVLSYTPVSGVTLRNFSIVGDFAGYKNSAVDANDFSNVATKSLWDGNGHAAILVDLADKKTSLKNISIDYPWSRGVEIKRTVGATVDNLSVNGAHNKSGGQGYGLTLTGAVETTVKNYSSENTRHALLFNAEDAEHFNKIHISETNRDINFHGLLDSDNIIMVDRMVQDYSSKANATWAAVHYDRAQNHVPTPKNINEVIFKEVSASEVTFNGDTKRHNDILYADASGAEMHGGIGNDLLYGANGPDMLYGDSGRDTLTGNGGKDTLQGGSDDDTIYGDDGDDDIWGGDGDDVIRGGADNDVIRGENGNDELYGDSGDDIINAGDGDDVINGGPGFDKMAGKAGADTYRYDKLGHSVEGSADIIMDFNPSEDMLDLSPAGYNSSNKNSRLEVSHKVISGKIHTIISGKRNVFEVWLKGVSLDLADINLK